MGEVSIYYKVSSKKANTIVEKRNLTIYYTPYLRTHYVAH